MNEEKDEKVVVKLKKEYLSSEREINKYKTLSLILAISLFISIIVVLFFGFNLGTKILNDEPVESHDKINEIKNIIKDQWVYGNDYDDLDSALNNKIYYGLTTFEEDPYTSYMSIDDMGYFSNSIDKIQLGIGISYYQEYDGYPYVLEVYKDSGAYNAGMKKGDRVVAIDQHSTLNCTDEQIKDYVLGDEGTYVEVAVNRNGEVITLNCERKIFDSTAHAELNGDVVILTLSSFGSNTAQTASNELKEYTDYHKLIIDLRDNTGGYQDSLLKVAALFLPNNTLVMKEIDKQGNETKFYADFSDHYYNFDNILILTNENTASAAEVFAICMKEMHSNTTLAGKETYGKGVVQTSYQLSDGSFLKVTISYWTSPNGVPLKDSGILPDIELPLDEVFYTYKYEFNEGDTFAIDSVSAYTSSMEKALKYLGYSINRTDGYFDQSFEDALNLYKKDHGLEEDGILDKISYEKIYDSIRLSDKDEQLSAALNIING